MHKKNDWGIIKDIAEHDEIKFVIGDRDDYNWSKEKIRDYNLENKTILFSPVHDVLNPKKLSKWILEDGLNVRIQIQLHKHIWSSETKGV